MSYDYIPLKAIRLIAVTLTRYKEQGKKKSNEDLGYELIILRVSIQKPTH
jgi:hypothetical protein